MSFSEMMGDSFPKLKVCISTERMKRGSCTCWNLSWIKLRMDSASSWPEGPVVRLFQLISMDITSWVRWEMGQVGLRRLTCGFVFISGDSSPDHSP